MALGLLTAVQPSTGLVLAGLVLLLLASLPLGACLVRLVEWFRGKRFQLTVPERVVVSLYSAGGLFFVFASVPLPFYTGPLVVTLLVLGWAALLVVWWREDFRAVRSSASWLGSYPSLLLALLTAAVLLLEVGGTGGFAFPNAFDGSFQSLLVKLIIAHHTLPFTLQPYATIGVVYPQGSSVWMTLPVILFGWPIASTPVTVPLLYLSLSVVGAYCWGERLAGVGSVGGARTGLVFAAFFAVLASWPRLFIGGSYDFVLALPLFFVALGWIRPFVVGRVRSWGETIAFGALIGIATSLSLVVGETLLLLLAAFLLAFRTPRPFTDFLRVSARVLAIAGLAVAFVVRSLLGFALWWNYPSRTLAPVGSPPFFPGAAASLPALSVVIGELDPFVPWKPKMSPLPILSLELQLLLAAGLVLLAWAWWAGRSDIGVVQESLRTLAAFTLVLFGFTAFLLGIEATPLGASAIGGLTNVGEESILLFIAYQAIAALPLVALVDYLWKSRIAGHASPVPPPAKPSPASVRGNHAAVNGPIARSWVAALLVVVVCFAVGTGVTAAQGTGYLHSHLEDFANVSAADVQALEWSSSHLPSCSRVLSAPGSAAMFLPLYSAAQLLYPMVPTPTNYSYNEAVIDFTQGTYTNTTRAELLDLDVTEVFVTGQTSVSYPPFDPAPLLGSSDFSVLFFVGDALVLAFEPGVTATGCAPVP
jgi:hypothetical protein